MKKKALLIGNSNFTDPRIEALSAPRNDIEALKALLDNPDIGGFDSVTAKFDISYADFKLSISRLFRNVEKDDLVVLYYAGHGIRDEDGDLYLASPETRSHDIDASALDAQYVLTKLRKSRSRKKIVILDCCHAGAVVDEGDFFLKRDAVDDAMLAENFVPKGEGTYVLAACKAGASAFESKTTHRSVYTSKFIEAIISGEAAPEKEVLTISDIHDYIRKERLHDKDLNSSNPHTEPMMIGSHTDAVEFCRNPKVRKPIDSDLLESLSAEKPATRIGAAMQLGDIVQGDDSYLAASAASVLRDRLKNETHFQVRNAIEQALEHERDVDDDVIEFGQSNITHAEPSPPPASRRGLDLQGIIYLIVFFIVIVFLISRVWIEVGSDTAKTVEITDTSKYPPELLDEIDYSFSEEKLADKFLALTTLKEYEKRAEAGDGVAALVAGWSYEFSKGVSENFIKARDYYEQACEGGVMGGCFSLGLLYNVGNGVLENNIQAATHYEKGCNGGHMPSCNNLGALYMRGQGSQMPQNIPKAQLLFEQSCDGGLPQGCAALAFMYVNEIGVEQDYAKARTLYDKACNGGNMMGCSHLGYLYEHAQGGEKDMTKAKALFEKACDGGEKLGCDNLYRISQ